MKKILFIIDNVFQYDKIINLIEKKNIPNVTFDFRHSNVKSQIWNHKDFVKGDKIIDVKNDYNWIIKNYDIVISVHCFQFFPKELVNNVTCINVHPGYNPINRGWYPQVFSIINNLDIGATIHVMDNKLDNGPIIVRKLVEKYDWDSSFTLYHRVLDVEIELLDTNLQSIIDGNYEVISPESKGNFFSKSDFNKLCEINMNQTGTYREFYNHLRAMTHGDYKNVYFISEESGEKIYISLNIEKNIK
jgi:methionyl-tRNA formyltransferase